MSLIIHGNLHRKIKAPILHNIIGNHLVDSIVILTSSIYIYRVTSLLIKRMTKRARTSKLFILRGGKIKGFKGLRGLVKRIFRNLMRVK